MLRSITHSTPSCISLVELGKRFIREGGRHNLAKRMSSITAETPVVEAEIISKLKAALNPTYLKVINESHMHNVPKHSETHFKVVVVSEEFNQKKALIQRHRLVNSILAVEIATDGPVHALSIVAKTPEQWSTLQQDNGGEGNIVFDSSPNCRGGDGSLPKRN